MNLKVNPHDLLLEMKKKSSIPSQLVYRMEYLTRLYEVLIMVGLAITPLLVMVYLVTFSPTPALRFVNHGYHEITIAIAILVSGFVTYVSWRSYQASGEIFLRWLTVGFLAFTIIYTPHGLLTRMADHNMWLFLLYGPVSRIVMLGCFVYGLLQYGKPAENVAEVTKSGFWWRVLILCVMVDIVVAVLAYSPIASSIWVRKPMEIGAIVLASSGISIMLIRHINSPLMKFYVIALVIFAQAPIAFMLAKPWEHLWWLAHIIFAGGFFILSWGVSRALLTTRSFSLAYSQEQLMRDNKQLKQVSRVDGLTQIANRSFFDKSLLIEVSKMSRASTPLTLILCDIDFFKNYNDTYGHVAGDNCLKRIAQSIKSSFARTDDVVARYGGEEFAVILANVDKETALTLADVMRKNVEKLKLEHNSSPVAEVVTISVGVTSLIPNKDTSVSMIIEQADKGLYAAKEKGRNNVQYFV
jgi:two-component system cell cycle response regulator